MLVEVDVFVEVDWFVVEIVVEEFGEFVGGFGVVFWDCV